MRRAAQQTKEPVDIEGVAAATFDRRATPLPDALPDALTAEFARDESKRRQWNAFSADLAIATGTFESVIEDLAAFLMPKVAHARHVAKVDK